jgi:hypothetical protein
MHTLWNKDGIKAKGLKMRIFTTTAPNSLKGDESKDADL